jgi:hypothetical protein
MAAFVFSGHGAAIPHSFSLSVSGADEHSQVLRSEK